MVFEWKHVHCLPRCHCRCGWAPQKKTARKFKLFESFSLRGKNVFVFFSLVFHILFHCPPEDKATLHCIILPIDQGTHTESVCSTHEMMNVFGKTIIFFFILTLENVLWYMMIVSRLTVSRHEHTHTTSAFPSKFRCKLSSIVLVSSRILSQSLDA